MPDTSTGDEAASVEVTEASLPGPTTERELTWAKLLVHEPDRFDQVVLSAEAHHHLSETPIGTPGLEGTFEFASATVTGSLRIARGTAAGAAALSIRLDPPRTEITPVHDPVLLEAEVREHWLQNVTARAASASEQAELIVKAVAELLAIPNQHTVAVTVPGLRQVS
jgi:hypothetical protein